MPRMRCIDNESYLNSLTVGNIYDVEEIIGRSDIYRVTGNTGGTFSCFRRRFEVVEPSNITRVRCIEQNHRRLTYQREYDVITSYEDRSENFYRVINDIGEQESFYTTRFEVVTENTNGEVSDVPVSNGFAVGDIVRIIRENSMYNGILAYIKEITSNNRISLNIGAFYYTPNDIVKVSEEELNIPVEPLAAVPEYTQVTIENQVIKKGTRVKLPTRRTLGEHLYESVIVKEALDNNYDYLTIDSINPSGSINVKHTENTYRFSSSNLEILNTNFVQGMLENGHRIKDKNGRTHTYEAYEVIRVGHILIADTASHIDYIDSTGWFIRQWKELVTKPRGTMQYTEYMAIAPEDYIAYKAEVESRIAYLKIVFNNAEIEERNLKIEEDKRAYANLKVAVEQLMLQERQRIEQQRAREENEARLREANALGIWKHHDKSWI